MAVSKGIAIGAIISVASTMVLSRFLAERGELRSLHGQVMISMTLVEDLAVIVVDRAAAVARPIRGRAADHRAWAVAKSLLMLVPVAVLAYKIVPPLMKRVSRTGNQELYLLVAVALGLATAAVTQAVGLSLALGAFLAGIIVSESETAKETLHHLLPIRDVFVALFFVTIGILVNPRVVVSSPLLLLTIVSLTMVGKFVIWSLLVRLFRYPWRTALSRWFGSHPDRRIFFCVDPRSPRRPDGQRRHLQCDTRSVGRDHSAQRIDYAGFAADGG